MFYFYTSGKVTFSWKGLISVVEGTEAYSEPSQTSKMDSFAKIVNGVQPLIIFAKHSILDVWQGSEYASEVFRIIND